MLELVLFLALLVTRNVIELLVVPGRLDRRRPRPRRGLYSLVLLGVAYFVSAAAVAHGLYRWDPPSAPLYAAGLLAMILGYVGRIVCLKQLGAAYSLSFETDPDGRLVTTGLFSVIRHPIYASYLLEMAAFLLIRFNAISALAAVAAAASCFYRIRREEEQLIEKSGERYLAYRRRTHALIPLVW